MRISGIIGLIVLTSGVLLAAGIIINGFETAYVNTSISATSPINQNLSSALVNESQLNETFAPLHAKVDDLQTSEGFLDVLGDASIVLPTLFIDFIITVLTLIGLSEQQTIALLEFIGVPLVLISFIVVALLVWFIFKIIEQLRRYPT